MVRTQVQLDEETYEEIRRRAFESRKSIAAVIREAIRDGLAPRAVAERPRYNFRCIGMGHSGYTDIAERHDDYLAEDLAQELAEDSA